MNSKFAAKPGNWNIRFRNEVTNGSKYYCSVHPMRFSSKLASSSLQNLREDGGKEDISHFDEKCQFNLGRGSVS